MDLKTFQRLSSLLISEDIDTSHQQEILGNFIYSTFLGSSNAPLAIFELAEKIKEETTFEFSVDEIEMLLTSEDKVFRKFHDREEHRFNLQDHIFAELTQQKQRSLEFFSRDFAVSKQLDPTTFTATLFRFLYSVMTKNVTSLKSFLETKQIRMDSVDDNFTQNDASAINEFLGIENDEKNELVFKSIILGLEYYISFNPKNEEIIDKIGLGSKCFLLDTNVIFRAIGLNGRKRMHSVVQFLTKAVETGNKIMVSFYTEKEFKESLDFHCKQVEDYKNVNSVLFSEFSAEEDFYKTYFLWKQRNKYFGPSKFEAEMLIAYDTLKKDFSITYLDKALDEEDSLVQNNIINYSRQIERHKKNLPFAAYSDFDIPDRSVFDAKNILLVEASRVKSSDIRDHELFMVSTDQQLIEWERRHSSYYPIIFLPSQWLVVLLRYHSRSPDDYAGFVGFINLSVKKSYFSNATLVAILEGIGQQTDDMARQETILEVITKTKIEKILASHKPEKIIARAKHESEQYEKNVLSETLKEKAAAEKKVMETTAAVTEMTRSLDASQSLVATRESDIEAYRQVIDQTLIRPRVFWYRMRGLLWLVPAATLVLYYCGFYFWPDSDWNISAKIAKFVDSSSSDAAKNTFFGLNLVPYGGIAAFVTLFVRQTFRKENIETFRQKQIELFLNVDK